MGYNEELQANNEKLQVILDAVNALPNADDYVFNPESGAVGQALVVKELDENGRPAKWETVDFPEGGGVGVTGEVVRPKDLQDYTPKHYMKMANILSTADGSALPFEDWNWSSVAYGENTMVMITSGTLAARKVDGKQWESITLPTSANWTDIANGDGYFVAIASGDSEFAVSYDGVEWELVDTGVTASWTSIVWSGTEFIVTQDGSIEPWGAMVCSGDVYYDWQYVSTIPPANKALCVNGKYYLLGVAALYVGDDIWSGVWTDNSVDGIVYWTPTDVVYGDGLFVAIDGSNNVYYSTDFITWSDPVLVICEADGFMSNLSHICYCNGRFAVFYDNHYYGVSASVEEMQNWEFMKAVNLGYPSYVYWAKSIGHQVVVLRDSVDEVPSYWYYDGGDGVRPTIEIITPPSGGGGGSYSDWSDEDKAAVLADVIAALPVYNGEVEDV